MRMNWEIELQPNGNGTDVTQRCELAPLSGTQRGEYLGLAASSKQFSTIGGFIIRVTDGKITDLWGLANSLSMMQQPGAIPTPEAV